jgi:hypothetical protein
MDPEFPFRAVKAMVEVAGFAYIGQALVAAFAGARRHDNVVYQVFKIITGPVTRVARWISPRFVPDQHVPFVAFGILLWIWFLAILGIAYVNLPPR